MATASQPGSLTQEGAQGYQAARLQSLRQCKVVGIMQFKSVLTQNKISQVRSPNQNEPTLVSVM